MTKRLLDHDPLTGITQWFEADESEDTFTIQTSQDVDGIVELNRAHMREFNRADDKFGEDFDHRTKVASIPLNIYFDLKRRGIMQDPAAFKRWLNDPDNLAFRTRPGRI